MIWDSSSIEKLELVFKEKYISLFKDKYGDKYDNDSKNRSAIWNKYIKNYDCKIVRNDIIPGEIPSARPFSAKGRVPIVRRNPCDTITLNNLIHLINFKNDFVADSLMIANPDRFNQYILISRDMAERILAIGMI